MSIPRVPRSLFGYGAASIVCMILTAASARADWNPGDPAKWVQLPELTTAGMDVQDFINFQIPPDPRTLADDWLCATTGPVTNIHIWGSWKGDPSVPAPGVSFTLAIHTDIAAEQSPTGYSMPGPVAWWRTYASTEYAVRPYASGLEEWYFDPLTGLWAFPGDTVCFQFNFPVGDGNDPGFTQTGTPQEPVVYWLEVQASYGADPSVYFYGWKTSPDHWNDCAVFAPQFAPYVGEGWLKILYPVGVGHPLQGRNVDLAFVIDGASPLDFGDAPDGFAAPGYPTHLVNGGARHSLGSPLVLGAQVDSEADGQPNATASGDDIAGADDEDGVVMPATFYRYETAKMQVTASADGKLDAWIDLNADADWDDPGEQMAASLAVTAGVNIVSFFVPGTAATGVVTFTRFRLSTAGGLLPTGLAGDGEVEDYMVRLLDRFPPLVGPKWIQPPDLHYGIDIQSWGYLQSPFGPYLVADDWWCDGRPIDAIRWWGSYQGYGGVSNAPGIPGERLRPLGFRLHWFTDVPATNSPTGYSLPGPQVLYRDFPLLGYSNPLDSYGAVKEVYAGTVDLSFLGPAYAGHIEHKFCYDLYLDESWNEKAENVYWLGIEALYENEPINYPWGWSTTPSLYNWNDDAVVRTNGPTGELIWGEMTYLPALPPYTTRDTHPYLGQSVNMAYQLLSRVRPRRAYIWREPPDMTYGTDLESWRHEPQQQGIYQLRADDWLAEGRRVSNVHWWGSYLGWGSFYSGPGLEPPTGGSSPLGFNLSWHADDDGMPGAVLTNLFVPLAYCHQTYYCCVTQFWIDAKYYEHEYQYYVDLLDPRVSGVPWDVETNAWYWLDIQALFLPGFEPSPPPGHTGWGWKTTAVSEPQGNPSVVSNSASGGWEFAVYQPPHPYSSPPPPFAARLAFELTTDQVGTNRWHVAPNIVDIVVPTNTADTVLVASVGDVGSGEQQLRMETVLTNAAFSTSVYSRPSPFPPPATNWFITTVATNLWEFYRIYQLVP